jgi:hypothetical protein
MADERLAVDGDDLAGLVDLFGALTREELREALAELAFRRGVEPPPERVIDDAVDAYQLVAHDGRLHPGPAAFPTLPEGAEDVPHILDVEGRSVDRRTLGEAVERRFRGETARALAAGDGDRLARLLDVSYDIESWGPVELGDVRARLDDAAGRE